MYELLISMQKYYGNQTSGANKIVRASMHKRSAGETPARGHELSGRVCAQAYNYYAWAECVWVAK